MVTEIDLRMVTSTRSSIFNSLCKVGEKCPMSYNKKKVNYISD